MSVLKANRRVAILLAAFGLLQVADILTTTVVLSRGGWEGNPVMAAAMQTFGSGWYVPKLALMIAAGVLMARWSPRAIAVCVALMALVVANNSIWMLGL